MKNNGQLKNKTGATVFILIKLYWPTILVDMSGNSRLTIFIKIPRSQQAISGNFWDYTT